MPDARTARLLALATFLAVWTSLPHTDPDLWGHLIYGRAALVELAPQPVDVYSYTAPGARWVNHEWWSEATLAGLWFGLGGWAMYALALGGAFALFAGMSAAAGPRAPGVLLALTGAAIAASCAPSWAYRPQLFSFLLYPAMLACIFLARDGRAPAVAGLAACFALWPNLHGGFLAGLCILALAAGVTTAEALLGRRPRRGAALLVAGFLLSLPATFLTPYGTELWQFLGRSLGKPRPAITEWAAVFTRTADGWTADPAEVVRGASCLLLGLWLTLRRRPRDPLPALILLATTAAWLKHQRHLPFLALTLVVVVPLALRDWDGPFAPDPDEPPRPVQSALMAVLTLTLLTLGGLFGQQGTPVATREYPVAALRILDHPTQHGRLLIHFDWAQYAIYRLHPRWRLAYDGRFRTVYPEPVERQFMAWNRGQSGWREILDGPWAPDVAMLPPDAPAVPWMSRAGWRVVYDDETAVLFVRDPRRRTALAARVAALRKAGHLDVPGRVPFPGR